MEWWIILIIVLGYILIGVIISPIVSNVFYKQNWIRDRAETDGFGVLCGILWPASPFIFLCFLINKAIGNLFNK